MTPAVRLVAGAVVAGSLAASALVAAQVALSPGVGLGPGGEGYVRFALIENEQRTQQALRNLKRSLTKLG